MSHFTYIEGFHEADYYQDQDRILVEFGDQVNYYIGGDHVEIKETIGDIWENCVVLSVMSILPLLRNLVIVNVCFGLAISSGWLSLKQFHIISASLGVYMLSTIEASNSQVVLFFCFLCSYFLLVSSCVFKQYLNIGNGNFMKIIVVPLLILCEYCLICPKIWIEIRGIVMVLTMKLISLAHDLETNNNNFPSIIHYFGYVLCGANVLFGPWISFNDYRSLYYKSVAKNIYWIFGILRAIVCSLIFLSLSNCWTNYLISDDCNRWLVGYKEAFSFRTSHYFVCYLSEIGMVAVGLNNAKNLVHRYTVTEPLDIEFPSSLAIVVKKWNKPMHEFLKRYVYRSWLKYGKFQAILATFFMSSFLHGLELKVSVVLINIGLFSYLQVIGRNKMASVFNCCIKVRPCTNCIHKYKRSDIRIKIILFIYSFATVLHLLYLGVLMDSSTDQIGLYAKWQNLFFISHIIMFLNYMFILM